MSANPFDTIESAHEYVRLLVLQIEQERSSIQDDVAEATTAGAARSLDALHIVDYKLTQLSRQLSTASRILNDLRMLRRVLLPDAQAATVSEDR